MSCAFAFNERAAGQDPSAKSHSSKPLAGYPVLIFDTIKVDPAVIQAGFAQAQVPVLQADIIVQLVQKKLFEQVIDRPESLAVQTRVPIPKGGAKPELVLTGTITAFDPGNQAARFLVGMGSGAAKLTMHFSFRDGSTRKEIFFTDHQHKFWFGTFGGSKKTAMTRTAEGMVKSLVDDIKRNR